MPTRTERIPLPDTAIAATTRGEVAGGLPPVVLIHGGPGLWDYLGPVAEMLAPHTVVHSYHQRGCGASDPAAVQSFEQTILDLEALRLHWGHERWMVAGHSFGAGVALGYAARFPHRTAGVGYLSGVGIGDWRTPFRAELARRRAPDVAARIDQLAGLRDRNAKQEREFRVLQWFTDYADPEVGRVAAAEFAAAPYSINWTANRRIVADLGGGGDDDVARAARGLRVPTLGVHGAKDPRPHQNAQALVELAHDHQWVLLPEAGHLPWVEQPAMVREVLVQFLHELSS
ncbi:alpha/beta fold hydrolase [Nakamurella aerolata]|uniref:Alpha/beta hydrolase n=1 Tax=Nakamurella aerolata TaxID=1656892 RepID=A0A849A661_9ACTN|nr:alpha/beta hydrolase [Nakamurella aerolata]NNG34511.1 alpha/beta hydrolase [Nakamurella aerolata]